MTEIRRILRITEDSNKNPQGFQSQVNIVLSHIMDMFDQVYGLRGTPTFYSNVDAGGNKITNAAEASEGSDVATKSQVDTKADAAHDHNYYTAQTYVRITDEYGIQVLDDTDTVIHQMGPQE